MVDPADKFANVAFPDTPSPPIVVMFPFESMYVLLFMLKVPATEVLPREDVPAVNPANDVFPVTPSDPSVVDPADSPARELAPVALIVVALTF